MRQPCISVTEPATFMTSRLETIQSCRSGCKTVSLGVQSVKFQKYDGQSGDSREHVVRFLDLMGLFTHNVGLCLRVFSKSLTDRAYTWYINLKPGTMRDSRHFVSLFNAKFFMLKQTSSLLSSTVCASDQEKTWARLLRDFMTKRWIAAIQWEKRYSSMFLSTVC